jgi:hypothetical protein
MVHTTLQMQLLLLMLQVVLGQQLMLTMLHLLQQVLTQVVQFQVKQLNLHV